MQLLCLSLVVMRCQPLRRALCDEIAPRVSNSVGAWFSLKFICGSLVVFDCSFCCPFHYGTELFELINGIF
ncbi:disulfide bond formation protein DsbD [Vibrio cholerae]|nr:disulfide bond formation protein DsbD [Vibrio cholerae]EGR1448317.1 disulfide bond formation protein DsbD [Vibrio cholerae]EGR2320803.1 disulfide bond formation protein DsbD [Vibrio cholerae]MCO4790084.1 disulfide bond formation protein DsbD [Vibrio cholerae]RJK83885.1 hypothetical protein CHN44_19195 [Vibrio cholerae]